MENRLASERSERRGGALIALTAIAVITVAWWALALWPAGAVVPEWLARTRAACFGARGDGLPDAGGWVLLVGEPLGMFGMFTALWGRSFQRDWHWLRERPALRFAALSALLAMAVFTVVLAVRVTRVLASSERIPIDSGGMPQRVDRLAPATFLVDQHGARVSLAELRGHPLLLTVAYGHCSTVCPVIVGEVQAARRRTGRTDVPVLVITVDPWRDTPERLPALTEHWDLAPNDRVLSGEVAAVEQVLDSLGIVRSRNDTTGDIAHATAVMLLDERARIAWRADGGAAHVSELLRLAGEGGALKPAQRR